MLVWVHNLAIDISYSHYPNLQVTFQTVLSSDGDASFAAFTYNDLTFLDVVRDSDNNSLLIGFDAGDGIRAAELDGQRSTFDQVNVFRIDGKNFGKSID